MLITSNSAEDRFAEKSNTPVVVSITSSLRGACNPGERRVSSGYLSLKHKVVSKAMSLFPRKINRLPVRDSYWRVALSVGSLSIQAGIRNHVHDKSTGCR
jgi:hypothetical protein